MIEALRLWPIEALNVRAMMLLAYRRENADRFGRDTDEQRCWDAVMGELVRRGIEVRA